MKIICIGRNYIDHAKELDNPVPDAPVIFMKPPSAILKSGKPFYIPEFSDDIHYEAELVVKIAKNGKYVSQSAAVDYCSEITVGIDFTARDIQNKLKKKGLPWELSKGFDQSAAFGSWLDFSKFPKDENIEFSLKKNGEIVQKGNSKDMIFNITFLVSYISKFFKLQIGDLIYTGTPAGVGRVEIGDVLEGYIFEEQLLHCEIR